MTDTDEKGVLAQEQDRQQFWASLGLPDPVRVVTETHATEKKIGGHFAHPRRAEVDAYLQAHPEKKPYQWDADPHLYRKRSS